jgi:hypothetical protein
VHGELSLILFTTSTSTAQYSRNIYYTLILFTTSTSTVQYSRNIYYTLIRGSLATCGIPFYIYSSFVIYSGILRWLQEVLMLRKCRRNPYYSASFKIRNRYNTTGGDEKCNISGNQLAVIVQMGPPKTVRQVQAGTRLPCAVRDDLTLTQHCIVCSQIITTTQYGYWLHQTRHKIQKYLRTKYYKTNEHTQKQQLTCYVKQAHSAVWKNINNALIYWLAMNIANQIN